MTKFICGQRRKNLVSKIMYNIQDDHKPPVMVYVGLQLGKFDSIDNSIKLEGTRNTWLQSHPGFLLREEVKKGTKQ